MFVGDSSRVVFFARPFECDKTTQQSGTAQELYASGISMEIDDTLDDVTSDERESSNRMPVTYPDKGL